MKMLRTPSSKTNDGMDIELSEIRIDKYPLQEGTKLAFGTNENKPEIGNSSKQKPSNYVAIKHKWNNFVETSTLHGLKYIFKSPTLFRKLIWAFFLVGGMAWFSFQSYRLLTKFFSYPVTTRVTLEHEETTDFPAVSICNFNMFRKSAVNTSEEYGEVLRYVIQRNQGLNNKAINWTKYENISSSELYLLVGHQIEDTIEYGCVMSGENCSAANFTPVLTSMGLCYTFNSGKNGQPILKVREPGANFGLRLRLNIHQDEYYGTESYKAGLKVLVHDPNTPPMVEQLGFSVAPGTSSYVAIRKEKIKNLKKPYKSNCSNHTVDDIPGYTTYTIAGCLLTCQTKHVVKKCGCRPPGMPRNEPVCGPREMVNCAFKELENFPSSDALGKCTCPVPCETVSYKQDLSYAKFPSSIWLQSDIHVTKNMTQEEMKQEYEYFRQNVLELYVYFQELHYNLIVQEPAFSYESLLGEIGGQLGLCVGASLLTVIEFCDVTFTILGIRFGFR